MAWIVNRSCGSLVSLPPEKRDAVHGNHEEAVLFSFNAGVPSRRDL